MRALSLALLALVGACAALPDQTRAVLPELRLPPSSLGASVSLAQRLSIARLPGTSDQAAVTQRQFDVLLEIDAHQLRLAGFSLGERIITLTWDGTQLTSERHPLLPADLDVARVLRDIELVYWPTAVLQSALPPDWVLSDSAQQRSLSYRGTPEVVVRYGDKARWTGRAELDNRLEKYLLSIESTPLSEH